MFQSSPAPKSGCNPFAAFLARLKLEVSILTRSEERVQLERRLDRLFPAKVSILTRSEERVQPTAPP